MSRRKFDPAFPPLPLLTVLLGVLKTGPKTTILTYDNPVMVIDLPGWSMDGENEVESITASSATELVVAWKDPILEGANLVITQWDPNVRGSNGSWIAPASMAVIEAPPAALSAKSVGDAPIDKSGSQKDLKPAK